MGEFFSELKRRHIYRVGAAYAVVAWVLLQLVNNVAPILDLPPWIARAILLLLVIGFPVALLLAWTFETYAQRMAPSSAGAAPVRGKTGVNDWVLAGALAVVIALIAYQQLAPAPGTRIAQAQQAATASTASPTPQAGGISIAVLPFENLSGDAGQEFFSDGMTEEITAALAKVPDLTVIGRTSAFQFKGRSEDLRTIGQALSASYLIEGSVRKAGDRVRITAQLIRADNGTHLWTESYDRQLTDIFAIQEDIAQAIAGALRVPLGLRQGETLVRSRTSDLESYDQYLRAKALVRARGIKPLTDAVALLEQVVARDPDYAPAWALLALGYDLTPNYNPAWFSGAVEETRRAADAYLPKAAAAGRRAIQLDANNADGHVSLGFAQQVRGKLLLAEEHYSKALALDPNNPDALHLYGQLLAEVRRLKEALAMRQRLQAVEPFVPIFNSSTAAVLWLNGQNDSAIMILEALPPVAPRGIVLGEIYAVAGRYREAADAVRAIPAGTFLPGVVEEAAHLLRTAPAAASLQIVPRLGLLGFVYLHVGAPNRVLEFHEGNLDAGYSSAINMAMLWHSSYAPIRKTERFKAFARAAGYVDYWRQKGWPDLCRAVGADDFVCD